MPSTNLYSRRQASENLSRKNQEISEAFLKKYPLPEVHKTHLFDGRYENIYLNETHIPQLTMLINEAIAHAEKILQQKNLRAGYWFNYMPPGSTTTAHTHDDDDELLSAAYYLSVPEDSGQLIIYPQQEKIEITPREGEFIFFKPDVRHEVSKNNSDQYRLSLGINFGLDKE